MRILFIEDEKDKQIEIIEYLKQIISDSIIDDAKSIMSGIIALSNKEYDVVLLDMSLPLYDPGVNDDDNEFEPFGGQDILDEIERRRLHSKVIVITAFDVIEDDAKRKTLDELDFDMKQGYPNNYIDCIHYDQSSLEWKSLISRWIGDGLL